MQRCTHILLMGVCLTTATASAQHIRSTRFDGTRDGFVRYDHQSQYEQVGTIEAWIYREDATRSCETIVSHGLEESWWFGVCNNSRLQFSRWGAPDTATAQVTIPQKQWVHVAVTFQVSLSFSPGEVDFFVNGEHVDSATVAASGDQVTTPLTIGADTFSGNRTRLTFQGHIDEVRLWNGARSASAIRSTMFTQLEANPGGPFGPSLVAVWNMGSHEESISGQDGTPDTGVSFSPFGILPRDLVVPRAALPVDVDGNIDPAGEYAGAEQMALTYYDPAFSAARDAEVYLVHDDDNVYIGVRFIRLPIDRRGENRVTFLIDPNFSQADLADDTHWRLDVPAEGGAPQWFVGDGSGGFLFSDGPPGAQWGLAQASCNDDVQPPCWELRLSRDLLGSFDEVDAFAIGHIGINEFGYAALAPGNMVENSPATWARMAYGQASADLPEAVITGQVRDGLSGLTSSPIEAHDVFLSTASAGILYTRATDSGGNYRFEVPVPADAELRIDIATCAGCLHTQDPLIDPSGIQPTSTAPTFVRFPGCADGTCSYADTTFFLRTPIGPVALNDAAQPRTTVIKDTAGDGIQSTLGGDDEMPSTFEVDSGQNGIAETTAAADDVQVLPVGEGIRQGSPEIALTDSLTILADTITISGENLHSELEVFLSPAASTGPPQDWEKYPVEIVGRDANERWLEVEVPRLPPEIQFDTNWKWLVVDNWQRPERVEFSDIGPFTYGPSYPDVHGFGFNNKARDASLDEFLAVYGNSAYVCVGAFGLCATRVPDPLYWTLWYGVYELWIGSSGGSCVGMAATSLLMQREQLQPETFDPTVHFPAGFADPDGPIDWHYSGLLGKLTGPPDPETIWAAIRMNHGVQTSDEFIEEAVRDMDLTLGGDPLERLGEIRNNPFTQVLCMRPQFFGTGHCVTPLCTRIIDSVISRIMIYDNNFREDETRFVDVNAFSNAFSFLKEDDEEWTGQHIFTAPLQLWQQSRTAPGLDDIDDLLLLLVFGDADGMYTAPGGATWGWQPDGTHIDNMPGVLPLVPLGPSETGTRNIPLVVPDGQTVPDLQINERGGDYLFHAASRGRMFQMDVRGAQPDGTAAVLPFIEQDNIYKGFRFTAGKQAASCTPRIGIATAERERAVYEWSGLSIPPGSSAEFTAVDDARGVTYTNDTGATTTHHLTLMTVDGRTGQASTKMYGPFDCPPGSTHTTTIEGWGTDMVMLKTALDTDGDGSPEQTGADRGFTCDGLPQSVPQDTDGDGVQDGCQTFGQADFDADGAVTTNDYAAFAECYSGTGRIPGPAPPLTRTQCLNTFDTNRDGDVDLFDYAYFAARMEAP